MVTVGFLMGCWRFINPKATSILTPGAFEFLGFEFRWGLCRWRKPLVKRRTATKKYRAALANLNAWFRENSHRPKREFFAQLAANRRGYNQYYGIRGNYERIRDFFKFASFCLYPHVFFQNCKFF